MKKISISIASLVVIAFLFAVFAMFLSFEAKTSLGQNAYPGPAPDQNAADPNQGADQNNPNQNNPSQNTVSGFVSPLENASQRINKKPFGIYVTPQNSPVQPERFTGYHTGVDFEIFPAELDQVVPVKAVCSGKLRAKETSQGYGGMLVQDCMLNNEPITVVYGHLKIDSISKNIGDELQTGEVIGNLGANNSAETGGERKHLHLAFHKGSDMNILGYVQNQNELDGWLKPCDYGICQ